MANEIVVNGVTVFATERGDETVNAVVTEAGALVVSKIVHAIINGRLEALPIPRYVFAPGEWKTVSYKP